MNNKGQSLLETAITIPIMLLIICGIIDFGLMFNAYHVVNNASREGARMAAIGKGDLEIESNIRSISSILENSKLSISITPAEGLRQKGGETEVRIDYQYDFLTPVISSLLPEQFVVSSKTIMRNE